MKFCIQQGLDTFHHHQFQFFVAYLRVVDGGFDEHNPVSMLLSYRRPAPQFPHITPLGYLHPALLPKGSKSDPLSSNPSGSRGLCIQRKRDGIATGRSQTVSVQFTCAHRYFKNIISLVLFELKEPPHQTSVTEKEGPHSEGDYVSRALGHPVSTTSFPSILDLLFNANYEPAEGNRWLCDAFQSVGTNQTYFNTYNLPLSSAPKGFR